MECLHYSGMHVCIKLDAYAANTCHHTCTHVHMYFLATSLSERLHTPILPAYNSTCMQAHMRAWTWKWSQTTSRPSRASQHCPSPRSSACTRTQTSPVTRMRPTTCSPPFWLCSPGSQQALAPAERTPWCSCAKPSLARYPPGQHLMLCVDVFAGARVHLAPIWGVAVLPGTTPCPASNHALQQGTDASTASSASVAATKHTRGINVQSQA